MQSREGCLYRSYVPIFLELSGHKTIYGDAPNASSAQCSRSYLQQLPRLCDFYISQKQQPLSASSDKRLSPLSSVLHLASFISISKPEDNEQPGARRDAGYYFNRINNFPFLNNKNNSHQLAATTLTSSLSFINWTSDASILVITPPSSKL